MDSIMVRTGFHGSISKHCYWWLPKLALLNLVLQSVAVVQIASAAAVIQVRGDLSVAFLHGQSPLTNRSSILVRFDAEHYEMFLEEGGTRTEVFGSRERTLTVRHYDPDPSKSALNTAMIQVFPDFRPFDSRTIEHLWFALFGGSLFAGSSPPLRDPGLCMAEPGIFSEWVLQNGESSPRWARWHNERSEDRGLTSPKIEGEFRWDQSAVAHAGLIVPSRSTMTFALTAPDGTAMPHSISQLSFHDVEGVDQRPRRNPSIQGRTVVFDYRQSGVWPPREPHVYDVADGVLPKLETSRISMTMIFIIAGILAISPVLYAAVKWKSTEVDGT